VINSYGRALSTNEVTGTGNPGRLGGKAIERQPIRFQYNKDSIDMKGIVLTVLLPRFRNVRFLPLKARRVEPQTSGSLALFPFALAFTHAPHSCILAHRRYSVHHQSTTFCLMRLTLISFLFMTLQTVHSLEVAIIGGGAAGLAATRVFARNGFHPTVLEKDSAVGGVWRHTPGDTTRPMYKGLRTNLPREIMAYREFSWGSGPGKR
jgi:hypothetical protein